MFNFFWNWLDPKILNMEKWVNAKVVEPDKIDIDLDKTRAGEVRDNNMFSKPIPGREDSATYGPFLTNLTGGELLGYMVGPGIVEAFCLLRKDEELWWRHRVDGTTEDFRVGAFDDMEEFFRYAHDDHAKYWECVLRTKCVLDESKAKTVPKLQVTDISVFIKNWKREHAAKTSAAE